MKGGEKALDNIRHEKFAKIISNPNNSEEPVEVYKRVYGVKHESARNRAALLTRRSDVRERILYLLQQHEDTKPEGILGHVRSHLYAKKGVNVGKGKIEYVDDNQAQGSAQEKVLKLYGLLGAQANQYNDRRSVSITNVAGDGEKVRELAGRLEELSEKMGMREEGPSGEVEDAEVV